MKKGLLLINLGTPDNSDVRSVRRYLAEFLADPRVIDLPAVFRYTLLYGFILPFRPRQSAHAYQAIWSEQGSPLLYFSQNLARKVQQHLGNEWKVVLGMRYGNPSIKSALEHLKDCASLTVLPLFPQYSSAATGSAIEKTLRCLTTQQVFPSLTVIRDFYRHSGFIVPQAALIAPYLSTHDHVLFSFHGLPERHLHKEGCQPVCSTACPAPTSGHAACYRAQCYATARALAGHLKLENQYWSVGFQSRLGKTPWISPYTDERLNELAAQGVKRLLVCCPSFTADCLETLEEIGIRAKEQWMQCTGEALTLVPCLNDNETWIQGIKKIIDTYTR